MYITNKGVVADLSKVHVPKVDKHSTGGVGDKISIHLAPIIAACGVAVPMISGRGLGHTGGTLDKLEAIPGFRTSLTLSEFSEQIEKIGLAIIGATKELAPADKKLYVLRDVTATVDCLPLICGSILSKKMAEGIDGLVLDVKFGDGALMKDKIKARELASAMVQIGLKMGKPTVALLTAMNQPLGRNVGNALEIVESIACLNPVGDARTTSNDLMEVTLALAEQMLILAGVAKDSVEANEKLLQSISSGAALAKFRELVVSQGGDPRVVDEPEKYLPAAKIQRPVKSNQEGYIVKVDAFKIAIIAQALGAGRLKASDTIDYAVGVSNIGKIGEKVTVDSVLAVLHTNSEHTVASSIDALREAFVIDPNPPTETVKLVDEVITC
eukprot:TRINITY_DN1501_c0_g1_i2.p1 TRINITY_DN1501_c0_g1~~TRINITY_DN1501_c0_g1_i2.p1  ORF type:complete len:384 (-),score=91.56 TRINITY_DN1501_c0_g1_i2:169-1320(-)